MTHARPGSSWRLGHPRTLRASATIAHAARSGWRSSITSSNRRRPAGIAARGSRPARSRPATPRRGRRQCNGMRCRLQVCCLRPVFPSVTHRAAGSGRPVLRLLVPQASVWPASTLSPIRLGRCQRPLTWIRTPRADVQSGSDTINGTLSAACRRQVKMISNLILSPGQDSNAPWFKLELSRRYCKLERRSQLSG